MAKFTHNRTGRQIEVGEGLAARYRGSDRWTEQGATEEVPQGTVQEIIEWVGNNEARRLAALEAEKAGKQRKGVLDALTIEG